MQTKRIIYYIYNIALVLALIELVFAYVWLESPTAVSASVLGNVPFLPSNKLSQNTAQSQNDFGNTQVAASFSALGDKFQSLQNESAALSASSSEKAGSISKEKNISLANKKTTAAVNTFAQTTEKSQSVSTQTNPPHNIPSAEDQAYNQASKTAVWPAGDRPKPVNGQPVLYPKLKTICSCESSYSGTAYGTPRQFENGKVLKNYGGNDDIGMCQINLTQFASMASKLGYDLYTPAGNINFANWLFEREGSAPWYKSKHCWGSVVKN